MVFLAKGRLGSMSELPWLIVVLKGLRPLVGACALSACLVPTVDAMVGDEATHESDHQEDVLELPEVHVHGLPLNKDQQLGPVAKTTPWPGIPSSLDGKEIDDWMKASMMVSKDAIVKVVVLEQFKHWAISFTDTVC